MSNRFGLEDLHECSACGTETLDAGNGYCDECIGEIADAAGDADTETLDEVEPLRF